MSIAGYRHPVPLDDRLVVVVPEGGQIELPLAGVATRAVAGAVDLAGATLLILALGWRPWRTDGLDVDSLSGWWLGSVAVLGALAIVVGWPLLWELVDSGRTPGKRALGLRVLAADGGQLTRRALVVRNVLRVFDVFPPPYGAGLAVATLTGRTQRVGDLAAGTVVVRQLAIDRAPLWGARGAAPVASALGPPPPPPVLAQPPPPSLRTAPPPAPAAPTPVVAPLDSSVWDTGGLTDVDRLIVRRFLERRSTLPLATRNWLGSELARRLVPKVVGAPPTVAPELFLEGIVHARR